MRSSTEAFGHVVAGSHRIAARVDVLLNRETIVEGIDVSSGSISFDRTAERLARLSLTVADPLLLPVANDDILSPFGYELQVWRGVELPGFRESPILTDDAGDALTDDEGATLLVDGTLTSDTTLYSVELIPLGVFPIQSTTADGVTALSAITAVDRSQLVSDARFEDDYQIAAGTNFSDAIEGMISDGVAGLEFNFPTLAFTTPLLTFAAQEDRWAKAQDMAKSIGHELFFDGLGVCTMRAEPSFTTEAVATISEGVNMTAASFALDRAGAYNRVIATSNNASSGEVFRGVATDEAAASPTNYNGPFGRKPRFYASEFIASDAQAESAAAGILAANLGVARSVTFAAVPDPRLECSDVVRITRSTLELDDLHIIDTLTIGLTADAPITGTSRTQVAE